MRLAAGMRRGPYEIRGALGAGGMGEVYRAHDTRLGRDLAIKVLPQTHANDPEGLARFEREARAVAALNHPNIVTLYAIEEIEGTRFLSMELVDGQPLSALVAGKGLPLDVLLSLAVQVTDALAAAHNKGILHRDLKEIARKLGVDLLVEGSVFRAGDRVRVTPQLIRGDSDDHVWADKYDRDTGDVLSFHG